jgi:hypothetical protein
VTLRIDVDGNEVTLTGTTKGDPVDEQARQGTAWRWSRHVGAFVLPRNLHPGTRARNIRALVAAYKAAGRDVEVVDTGTVLSVAEEREQERQRLEHRAERLTGRAERLEGEAKAAFATVDRISDSIPLGQPILVDHYSAKRHRRDLAKMERNMDRGCEASQEAREADRLAGGIKRSLDNGTPLSTLRRRIDRYEAEIRDYDRRLDGTSVASNYGRPAEGGYRERLLTARARAQEALNLDRAELDRRAEEDGVKVWTRADFQKGDLVVYRFGDGVPVLRVNAKSLTVPHGIEALAAAGATWTIGYDQVKGRRPAPAESAGKGGRHDRARVADRRLRRGGRRSSPGMGDPEGVRAGSDRRHPGMGLTSCAMGDQTWTSPPRGRLACGRHARAVRRRPGACSVRAARRQAPDPVLCQRVTHPRAHRSLGTAHGAGDPRGRSLMGDTPLPVGRARFDPWLPLEGSRRNNPTAIETIAGC